MRAGGREGRREGRKARSRMWIMMRAKARGPMLLMICEII